MKSIIRTSAIVLLIGMVACESSPKSGEDSVEIAEEKNEEAFNSSPKESDADFIVHAVDASYSDIALANTALLNSNDSALQRKVRMVESDHMRYLGELEAYAKSRSIAVPTEESTKTQSELRGLSDSKSEEFDAAFCAMARDRLEEEIRKFETCMSRTEDVELKNWIAVTLPALNDQLTMIKEHQVTLKSNSK